jgi:hypothetical protein
LDDFSGLNLTLKGDSIEKVFSEIAMTSKQKLFVLIALVILTAGICLHVALIKQPLNYQVITTAAANILSGQNPYAPQQGLNFFKYSPLAGLLTVPFSLLVDEIGMFLFVFLQFWMFLWGFWYWARTAGFRLEKSLAVFLLAFISIIFDTTVNVQNCQVNAWILGLMLIGAAQYAEGKFIKSGLLLSLASNLKLFPFTLGLCFLTGFKKKYWIAFGGGLFLWFMLPALILGWDRNLVLLNQWIDLMAWDQTRSLNMLDIGSFLERHFGLSAWFRNPLAVFVGLLIGLGTWMLFRQKKYSFLCRFLLPINGLYILLFSYLSESATSILAVPLIFLLAMEFLSVPRLQWIFIILWVLALVLVPLFYSDMVPVEWSRWARDFHLKTLGYLYLGVVACILFDRQYKRKTATVRLDSEGP